MRYLDPSPGGRGWPSQQAYMDLLNQWLNWFWIGLGRSMSCAMRMFRTAPEAARPNQAAGGHVCVCPSVDLWPARFLHPFEQQRQAESKTR